MTASMRLSFGCALAIGALLALEATGITAGGARGTPLQLVPGELRALAKGRLLVAAKELSDPNFAKTVILLIDYSPQGAAGLILNRRSDVTLASALPKLTPRPAPSLTFYLGGPVGTDGIMGLVQSDAPPAGESRHVDGNIYAIVDGKPLERLMTGTQDPDRFRAYLGYAGWGPGQLQGETAQGAWHVVKSEPRVIFDRDPESLWQREIRGTDGLSAANRRTGEPANR